jgi:hypothetical protein
MIGRSLKLHLMLGLDIRDADFTTQTQRDALVSGVEAPVRCQIWPLRDAIQWASISEARRTHHAI